MGIEQQEMMQFPADSIQHQQLRDPLSLQYSRGGQGLQIGFCDE